MSAERLNDRLIRPIKIVTTSQSNTQSTTKTTPKISQEPFTPSSPTKSLLSVYNRETDESPLLENSPELQNLHARVRRLLQLEQKTKQEAAFLLEHLGHLTFIYEFRQQSKEIDEAEAMLYLARNLRYEQYPEGQLVFKEGDSSNGKMYIVLTGEVLVIKKVVDHYTLKNLEMWEKIEEERKKKEMLAKLKQRFEQGSPTRTPGRRVTKKAAIIKSTQTMQDLVAQYGDIVDRYADGRHFGEKAIVSDAPRAATIMTSKPTELLVLSGEVFKNIQIKFQKGQVKKLNFMLQYFPAVDRIHNRQILENLLYLLEEKHFSINNLITEEGELGEYFFMLYEGSCDIYKKDSDYVEPKEGCRSTVIPTFINKGRNFICTVSQGIFLGEEILFNSSGKYEYTIRAASSSTSVIAIDKSKFNLRFPQSAYWSIQRTHTEKKAHYQNLLEKNLKEKRRQESERHHKFSPLKKRMMTKSTTNLIPNEKKEPEIPPIKISQIMTSRDEHPQKDLYKVFYKNKHTELNRMTTIVNTHKLQLGQLEEKSPQSHRLRRAEGVPEQPLPYAEEVRFNFGRGDTPLKVSHREKLERRRLNPKGEAESLDIQGRPQKKAEKFQIDTSIGETDDHVLLKLIEKANKITNYLHEPKTTIYMTEVSEKLSSCQSPYEKLFNGDNNLTIEDIRHMYQSLTRDSPVSNRSSVARHKKINDQLRRRPKEVISKLNALQRTLTNGTSTFDLSQGSESFYLGRWKSNEGDESQRSNRKVNLTKNMIPSELIDGPLTDRV